MKESRIVAGALTRFRHITVPLIVLIIAVLGTGAFSPRLLQISSLLSFLTDACPLLILVIGSTLPVLLGSLDLSVAGMASLASVLAVKFNPELGSASAVAVVVLCGAIGAFQGFLQAWAQIPSLVMTLGMLGILQGTAMLITDGASEALPPSDIVMSFIGRTSGGLPHSVFVVLFVLFILGAIMRYTRVGRDIYASGSGERAAALSGVNNIRVRVIAFGTSSACGALSGLMLLSITTFSSPNLAGNFLLLSVVGVLIGGVAVSGGVGGLLSSVIGGLMAAWFSIATVVIGIGAEAQNAVFGIMALVAGALTTDRSKIGIIK